MMRRLFLHLAAVAVAVTFATAVHAQPAPTAAPPPLPDYGPNITLEQAMTVANAALAESKKLNVVEGIAVVDTGGNLVYFIKMDGLRVVGIELAQKKARTAAITKLPSKAYEDRVASGGIGLGVLAIDSVLPFGGGIPIVVGGKIIGAIGVGGGPSSALDVQAAQAGVDALK